MSTASQYLIPYGPDTNCTLALCPVEDSVLEYRPSRPANGTFIALFSIALIVHLVLGSYWRSWGYMSCMVIGCLDEILGYMGRIWLYYNPFSFAGFMIEIICVTTAPVFFCAAIYVTLYKMIMFLDPSLSRFRPKLVYWCFIPCDIFSLVLQAVGGASSSTSSGDSQWAVDISLAGLGLQVFTLVVFITLAADYIIRYMNSNSRREFNSAFKLFLASLSISILLILVRCSYRIGELSQGYSGSLFTNEKLFIVLESCMVTISVFCLIGAIPGRAISGKTRVKSEQEHSFLP